MFDKAKSFQITRAYASCVLFSNLTYMCVYVCESSRPKENKLLIYLNVMIEKKKGNYPIRGTY